MPKNIIIFDFDGVVIDSFDVTLEVQKILNPKITAGVYRKGFENNILDWQNEIGESNSIDKEMAKFFKISAPMILERVKFFDGMRDVVDSLHEKYPLYIVTSNNTALLKEYLHKHDFDNRFIKILGNDVHKCKAEKIKKIMEENENDTNYLMITDTLGDMKEAAKVNVPTIGVTWGYHQKEVLEQGDTYALVDTPEELVEMISKYFN